VYGFIRMTAKSSLTLLKADFKIGKDMLYMIVDTLEYDTPVRARFGLE
jgi:hypothetical protein